MLSRKYNANIAWNRAGGKKTPRAAFALFLPVASDSCRVKRMARPWLHLEPNCPATTSRCLSQRPSPLRSLSADGWLQEKAISATMPFFFFLSALANQKHPPSRRHVTTVPQKINVMDHFLVTPGAVTLLSDAQQQANRKCTIIRGDRGES